MTYKVVLPMFILSNLSLAHLHDEGPPSSKGSKQIASTLS